ncbi:MAG: prefoldin subunit [Proteobacteria bacterium]|nr:prefoldin subunit [Pseudomonadota bacterium]
MPPDPFLQGTGWGQQCLCRTRKITRAVFFYALWKDLQNLEDAGDELMLADDDQPIPYPHINYYYF